MEKKYCIDYSGMIEPEEAGWESSILRAEFRTHPDGLGSPSPNCLCLSVHFRSAFIGRMPDVMSTFAPDTDLQSFESRKALISVDTLKAMQLLGFDYKKAIGDPFTAVCAQAITNSLGGAKKGSGGPGRKSTSNGKRG